METTPLAQWQNPCCTSCCGYSWKSSKPLTNKIFEKWFYRQAPFPGYLVVGIRTGVPDEIQNTKTFYESPAIYSKICINCKTKFFWKKLVVKTSDVLQEIEKVEFLVKVMLLDHREFPSKTISWKFSKLFQMTYSFLPQ